MFRHLLLLCALLPGCFTISESERAARWDLDDDGIERPEDCDDMDPLAGLPLQFFADNDGDGYGDPGRPEPGCVAPAGTVDNDSDCNDDEVLAFDGAPETCDGIDNDCDGEVDEIGPPVRWYRDADGDGDGDPDESIEDCRQPDGYVKSNEDCDDTDAEVNGDAEEVCGDGIDNDCNGAADNDDPRIPQILWYVDDDGDSFGQENSGALARCPGDGFVMVGNDCDDADELQNPLGEEICNGEDDDCNGQEDDDPSGPGSSIYGFDGDGDSFGDALNTIVACDDPGPGGDWVPNISDCDDSMATSFPGATEICGNVEDDDCDGVVDELTCEVAP